MIYKTFYKRNLNKDFALILCEDLKEKKSAFQFLEHLLLTILKP